MGRIADLRAEESYKDFAAVTPHDSNNIQFNSVDRVTDAIFVGTAGAVAIVDQRGNAITLGNVPAGTLLRVAIRRVNATNTTASNIVAFWY